MSTLVTGALRTGTRERSRTPVRPPETAAVPDKADDPVRCQRRRTMRLFAAGAAGLLPWTVVVAVTPPAEHQVHQLPLTRAGFHVLPIAALDPPAAPGRRPP